MSTNKDGRGDGHFQRRPNHDAVKSLNALKDGKRV